MLTSSLVVGELHVRFWSNAAKKVDVFVGMESGHGLG